MFIVDAHQDIAFNVVNHGRDFRRPVAETRAAEGDRSADIATLGLPDAVEGGVGLVFGTLYVAPASAQHLAGEKVYNDAEQAHRQAREQLEVYRDLAGDPQIPLVLTRRDLRALRDGSARGERRLGIVVLMEGADPIREPAEAGEWHAEGVRIVGPAWGATRYSGGTGAPGPLTKDGRALMREMSRAGLALDVSHMAERSFWEAMDLFEGPVLASHSNCRALVPGPRDDRHLSNAMLKALIERGGVVGTVLFNRFLDAGWSPAAGKGAVSIESAVRHIDHVCQLAGSARHAAIGSDLDGGFGCEAIPREIDSVADLRRIGEALGAAGFADADIEAIMGGNWLRLLESVLPDA